MNRKRTTTRTVETEVGGIVIRYELTYPDDAAGLAYEINDRMTTAIERPAALQNQQPRYWQVTETTFSRSFSGQMPVQVAPVENPDPEEWSVAG